MKTWLNDNYKNYAIFTVIALFLKFVSFQVGSDFLDTFLQDNLIVLLPALLAINVTTLSIMLTKINDLKKAYKQVSFKNVIDGMKQSVLEQVLLIVLSVVILILRSSKNISFLSSQDGQNILGIVLIVCASAALHTVIDTANALFSFLTTEDEITQ
jgi:hypothetical protein